MVEKARTPATLIGCAVADALGMPFETRRPDDPFLTGWDGQTYLHSEFHQLKPGQWTDDTMMSRILAESLVAYNGYDGPNTAFRYMEWFQNGPHRGMGKTTGLALKSLTLGESWRRSGIPGAEGNGTAMRAAPIGVFYLDDLGQVVDAAQEDAYITHASKEASEGAVIIALAAAYVARGWAKESLLPWLCGFDTDCEVWANIRKLDYSINARTVQQALARFGTKAHVVQTVPSAIAAFVLTDSYMEAVQAAIRAGGDTDTTAAIAGALAGTYYGLEAIPAHLVKDLEDRDALLALDRKLFGG